MFRFAYANMNSVSSAAANCAEAASSCANNNTMLNIAMDAALAASISISIITILAIRLSLLRVISLLGLIIISRAGLGENSQA